MNITPLQCALCQILVTFSHWIKSSRKSSINRQCQQPIFSASPNDRTNIAPTKITRSTYSQFCEPDPLRAHILYVVRGHSKKSRQLRWWRRIGYIKKFSQYLKAMVSKTTNETQCPRMWHHNCFPRDFGMAELYLVLSVDAFLVNAARIQFRI